MRPHSMPPRRRPELCSALQAELTPRADAELAVDVAQVIFDGLLADVYLLRDLLVRHALSDQRHHVLFTLGEVERRALCRRSDSTRRQVVGDRLLVRLR